MTTLNEVQLNPTQIVNVPYDSNTQITTMQYKIREVTLLNSKQEEQIKNQGLFIVSLQRKIDELNERVCLADNYERELKATQVKIEANDKEHQEELLEKDKELRVLRNKIAALQSEIEQTKTKHKLKFDLVTQKIDLIDYLQLEYKSNQVKIEDLKQEKEQIKHEAEEIIRKKEINNQNKYAKLKNTMVGSIQTIKKQVTNLQLEYADVSSKLTVLQNHELIIQIEYQAEQISELEKNKEELSRKIFDLKKELDIHKEVALSLAEKTKQKDNENRDRNESENNRLLNEINFAESQIKAASNHYERKIFLLNRTIKGKEEECERMKLINMELKQKINQYERKYSGLYNFFEDSLNNFFHDELIERNKDLNINIEHIKKCDFTIFSSEEKYALLVLIMKYLLPIVSINMNAPCNVGNQRFETNLNLINRKYDITDKYLRDPDLRKAFLEKNNKMNNKLLKISASSNRFSNSIPIMKRTSSEIDYRLNNNKHKAVYL